MQLYHQHVTCPNTAPYSRESVVLALDPHYVVSELQDDPTGWRFDVTLDAECYVNASAAPRMGAPEYPMPEPGGIGLLVGAFLIAWLWRQSR